jgi:tRNA G18 (ribose-2'-O)-methylase SpoU
MTRDPRSRVATVQCPSDACGAVFDLPGERLGRNVYCLECGARMTARPIQIAEELLRRERTIQGGTGITVDRLPLRVVVDNVRSLWNVGSIFRTADACGVERLLLTGITGCPPRAEITKTALGAEQSVAWSYHARGGDALAEACQDGYRPVAIESAPGAVSLDAMRWPDRVCLVLGNEVAGVSEGLLHSCEGRVQIPMMGIKQSLNVAVAFGIVAYRASRSLVESSSGVGTD